MSVHVLGISALYHDSAAALLRDGEIVAAAQEERFTRRRHDAGFPSHAVNYCLEEAFIEPAELDAVVFYDSPLLSLDRVVRSARAAAPGGAAQWQAAARSMLGTKLRLREALERVLGAAPKVLHFAHHHHSHAASAFFPSPFAEAAILTVDGVGEWATTSLGLGRDSRVELLREIRYPHSLGLLYSAFTQFCGFKVNSGEYKLMGLAPYGRPVHAERIRENLIELRTDGSFRLNLEHFGFVDGMSMIGEGFSRLFGGPARAPESRITRREMDLAASVQQVLEEALLSLARAARQDTGCRDLALAGGVALNCVANGRILRERVFERLWIQPAAGDAGGALGAAYLGSHAVLGVPRPVPVQGRDRQQASLLGPGFSPSEVRAFLERRGAPYHVFAERDKRAAEIARALARGEIVGFFAGRMEFGPRSLGARSILADPRHPEAQARVNLGVKFRESFRPFAPAVLAERAQEYFDLECASPYMMLVAPVQQARRLPMDWGRAGADDDMLALVNQPRSDIPAVTHVDYSARVQTVAKEDNPALHAVLSAFDALTGCPVLVNTSFNVRGEPIVCSPRDAYLCFMRAGIDLLVIEDCLLRKEEQPPLEGDADWRKQLELD
ncbi:MAG: carbamoyltransferase family protein [Betaproteobacteria bacterium]